ncbi:MAG: hypothetical protein IJ816_05360 [Alloprevotella sp.]|nr:hypothetical protein [Alloprevotella sp.]
MKNSQSVLSQLQQVLRKLEPALSSLDEFMPLTDILFEWKAEEKVLVVCDDEERELVRGAIDAWAEQGENLEEVEIAEALRGAIASVKAEMDSLSVLKPFAFVLMKEESGDTEEIYRVDDENVILEDSLMKNLDEDLDAFWEKLCRE